MSFSEQVVSASEKWKCSHAVLLYDIQLCLKKCRRCHKESLVGLQDGGVKGDQYRIMFFWFLARCYGLIRGVPEFQRNILPPHYMIGPLYDNIPSNRMPNRKMATGLSYYAL